MERFQAAEDELKKAGLNVVNPTKMNQFWPEGIPWEAYMSVGIAALMYCDSIYMLKGWRESRGTTMEYQIALQTGKTVFYEGGAPEQGVTIHINS